MTVVGTAAPAADRAAPGTSVAGHLVVSGTSKRFGAAVVLDSLSISVAKGEFVSLLGPSGCGKTTLLRCVAGLLRPDAGRITVAGQDITTLPAHKRNVGVVFQNYALFPHMTVAENVAYPLEVRGMGRSEREDRVRRALEMVKMAGFGGRRPAQLSGGQQQRIALARALVFEPELVLMDEPLGALDKQLREHMQFEITRLSHQLGLTVVYVTHDQSEALTMSDRIAVFNDGVIQQLAAPDELYERPRNSFVAQFIGENNTLPGRIETIDSGRATVRLDSGDLIDATPVNVLEAGARTLVSIRPERVEYGPGSIPPGAHTLEAEVIEVIYMGDSFRTRLRLGGSDDFVMKSRNAMGRRRLAPGERITVGWSPQDARALNPM